MEKIVKFLKEKESEMVDLLKQFVEMESPSQEKEMVDRLGEKIRETFIRYVGGKIAIIENAHAGNHLRAEFGEGDEQILLLMHMDTVWPKGTVDTMPFCIDGDKVFGPGTFDMKGGIVQGIFALHALREMGVSLNTKVVVLITSDEESGSETSRSLIEEEAKKSKYVLVLESASSTSGKLKTSRKGVGMFHIKLTGRAAHSGIEPEKGISAIEELARIILYLHSLSDVNKGITLNVGVINGGSASNVIAAEAEAEVDLRVTNQSQFDAILPFISNLQPSKEGLTIDVTGGINRPPLEKTAEIKKMFQLAKEFSKTYLDFDLEEEMSGGGSDGSFASQFAPTLDGLGPVGDGAHAGHEHLLISQMPVRSALVALLILGLGKKL
ncbi:M20 family metallopeptidase [Cytobacillus depressus]|uniref:M20 family metallopeptidase n=1 Tax=Cytobacillus depressus TaxID=1602942 RepID=A0A6L3VB32_9BACI|nr:M20 family metallopeptidase [Cytobacillus depressus]KAB2336722.1 M20 family metallopeptidase [Cytobacillus depressus]